jgi:hypothetical protein
VKSLALSVLRWIGTVVVLHVTVNDVCVSAVGMDPERDDIGDRCYRCCEASDTVVTLVARRRDDDAPSQPDGPGAPPTPNPILRPGRCALGQAERQRRHPSL